VAAGRFAQKIERLKLMTSLCASMPAQAAIADYLQHGTDPSAAAVALASPNPVFDW